MPVSMRPRTTTMISGQTMRLDAGRYGEVELDANDSHVIVRNALDNAVITVPVEPHHFDPNYGQAYIKEFNLTVNVDRTKPRPPHSALRLKVGEYAELTIGNMMVYVEVPDGLQAVITSPTGPLLPPHTYRQVLPITSRKNFGIAHSEELNLDIVVIPREVSEPGIFDTGITDEEGQTHLKTGNLQVNGDGSWCVHGRYGPIAAGSAGAPVPVKVHRLHCGICGKTVPKRSIEDLIQMQWTGVEIKRDGERREKAYICPDHSREEIIAFMGSAIERGKIPKTRAHCIKVRGREDER